MSLASAVSDMLARNGRAMTLKRRVGTSAAFTEASVTGYASAYRPEQITGLVRQGDLKVVIGPDTGAVAAPLKAPDMIVIDGRSYAVQGATARMVGDAIAGYELWVRGG